ncbi:hypothetical protein EDB85DRAFT_1887462 [Lactarius pseudohatsudake]|nr:hypothetical protein EDB85DRAFT_1887462 [Lactarius pseudohatsudake]
MQVTGQSRGHLVTTYARRKGRSRVFNVSSSPIKATDCEDLSLAEMNQRMKKRARQSNQIQTYTESQKVLKRPKNTHALALPLPPDFDDKCNSSNSTLDSLISLNDETNNLQYQTPFNLSPVNSPTAPDPMSPVPPSRRQLSRIGSRNLKENKSVKRLASPFHSRSVSRACSRSGSRANSPKMKIKKPSFYIKARTRSEANVAQSVENVSEVLFPISGSLPALGSMKSGACDSQSANCSTTYMLQNFSELDWFRPAKALSHSPFSEDYVPPGTPFHGWDYTSEAFLGGVPLQTSTPIVTNDPVRRHVHTEGTPSAPNTPDNGHVISNSHDITMQTCETKESCSRPQQHFNHDSIFSSYFDGSTTLSSLQSDCMDSENAFQDDNRSSPNPCLSDNGRMVTNLSGMLDTLDINGLKSSSMSLGHRSRSLDSAPTTVAPILPSDTQQATGRKRDRASTIRASDYMIKPAIAPCGRVTSTTVTALTTRTRSGTIRPAHPPLVPPANSSPRVDLQQHIEQTSVGSSASTSIITDEDKSLSGQAQGQSEQVSRNPRTNVETVEDMETDVDNDESDDELLLDRKGWNWDGRWE